MIEITRSLARQLRAVLKKATPRHAPRNSHPDLLIEAGSDGLRVRSIHGDIAVEYRQPGSYEADKLMLSGEALADFEGRKNELVTLAATDDGMQARWFGAGVPQMKQYPAVDADKLPEFPDAPTAWSDPGAGFLKAVADAHQCVGRDAVRFALTHLQLRGGKGEINATDGRQALIQAGFTFPFKEDVLVPAIPVFGSSDLPLDECVTIGKTDTRFGIRVGAWTFLLCIDRQARYPDVASVIPSACKSVTTWTLPAGDGAFLAKTLPRLPGKDDDDSPITVDLNGHAAVRARAEGNEQSTEVILSQSKIVGPPVRFRSNRRFVERALGFGIGEFKIVDASTPIMACDGNRKFVWMLLDKGRCVPPCDDGVRITSDIGPTDNTQPKQERRMKVKKSPQTNSVLRDEQPTSVASEAPKPNGIGALIEESQALKQILRDAFHRVQRLGGALKRHRQQSKTFQAALTSLKALQRIEA